MPCKHSAATAAQKTTFSNNKKSSFCRFFLKFLNLFPSLITQNTGDKIMHDEKKHFDQDSEPKVSNEFGADLKALFTPETTKSAQCHDFFGKLEVIRHDEAPFTGGNGFV